MGINKIQSHSKWAQRLFLWLNDEKAVEDLIGDANEIYNREKKQYSNLRANFRYVVQLFKLSVSYAVRKRKGQIWNVFPVTNSPNGMIKNYIKIAARGLVKNKLFTFINVISLAISMSVSLVIIGMIFDLIKYDNFHVNKERIFRVITKVNYPDYRTDLKATAPEPVAEKLASYSGIEKVVRIHGRFSGNIDTGDKIIPLRGYFVDGSFFEVFSFNLVKGNSALALKDPFSIVITKKAATKLFNSDDPLGKIIKVGNLGDFVVNGVIEDVPKYSHLQFEMLGSFSTIPILENEEKLFPVTDRWNQFFSTYVYTLLLPDANRDDIQFELDRISGSAYEKFDNLTAAFSLQSITDIVPGPDLSTQIGPKMMYLPVIILSIISLVILLSACFNYTNLSIARSLKRAKEFGIRKVSGGTGKQIFIQLIAETVIISLLSLGFSIVIFLMVRPEFLAIVPRASEMFDLELTFSLFIFFLIFSILIGILAGIIPALYFSGINPIKALQDSGSIKVLKRVNLRKVLITSQFALSLLFITGMVIIYKQYRFSLSYNFGFNQENILNVPLQGNNYAMLVNEFMQVPEVSKISKSSLIPGTGFMTGTWIKFPNGQDSIISNFMNIDHQYIDNLELKLLAGRNFDPLFSHHGESAAIVNQEFLKVFSVEHTLDIIDSIFIIHGNQFKIIGVIKDFHYSHLEDPIKPFMFTNDPKLFQYLNLKISPSHIAVTMNKLEDAWTAVDSKNEFKATFFEIQIQQTYGFMINFMKLFGFFGLVAITIAVLGLLGMAVFSAETRLKEVGIRKILGASNLNLIALLSVGFVKLLFIAAIIALPVVFLLFDKLFLALQHYRTYVGFQDMLIGFSIILVIGVLTVGSQAFNAARTNPSETLRNE